MISLAGLQIELGKIYTYRIEQDKISDRGVRDICTYLTSNTEILNWYRTSGRTYEQKLSFYNEGKLAVPADWKWTWMVKADKDKPQEYVGSLAKRLSKWIKVTTGVNISAIDMTKLANIAKINHIGPEIYNFDFTDRIDWEAGAFGEKETSCWWGSMSGARKMLTDGGGLAVRFYNDNDEDGSGGFARGWVVPNSPDERTFTLFNGYGFTDGYNSTSIIVKLLADWMSLSYKRISLMNEDGASPTFYINDQKGYVIGPKEVVDLCVSHSYHFHDPAARYCSHCNRIESDAVHINGERYCGQCAKELFTRCDLCREWRDKGEMIDFGTHNKRMCLHCQSQGYHECATCGRVSLSAVCARCVTEEQFIFERHRREEEFVARHASGLGTFHIGEYDYQFRVANDGSIQLNTPTIALQDHTLVGTALASTGWNGDEFEEFDDDDELDDEVQ